MKYLVVDALLNGTGIRDYYNSGYIEPESLHLSATVINQLNDWLLRYANEHYAGYINDDLIDELDREGKEIALKIRNELREVKIEYCSDAKLTKEMIL